MAVNPTRLENSPVRGGLGHDIFIVMRGEELDTPDLKFYASTDQAGANAVPGISIKPDSSATVTPTRIELIAFANLNLSEDHLGDELWVAVRLGNNVEGAVKALIISATSEKRLDADE